MQQLLQKKALDGALFIYPIDVYYFTGTRQNATLWLPASGEPVLLVKKAWHGPVWKALLQTSGLLQGARIFLLLSLKMRSKSV